IRPRTVPDFLTLESTITCLVTHTALTTDVRNRHGCGAAHSLANSQLAKADAAWLLWYCLAVVSKRLMCLAAEAVAKHWLPIICARSHKPETDCCKQPIQLAILQKQPPQLLLQGFICRRGLLQFVGLHSQHRQACRRCRPAAVGIGQASPIAVCAPSLLAAASVAKGDSSSSKSLSASVCQTSRDVDMRSDGRLQ
uniref:Secreted protein n=1 Tax=Macrostomum lignano TaxID=282301 RepID=A0A1I8FDM0_9PLAT